MTQRGRRSRADLGFLDRLWKAISEVQLGDLPGSGADPEGARKRAQAIVPVLWLLGKTGTGKTAIVGSHGRLGRGGWGRV
jgi:hypothetical protein